MIGAKVEEFIEDYKYDSVDILPDCSKQIEFDLFHFCLCYRIDEPINMTKLISTVSPTSNAVNAAMWQDYKGI